MRASLRVARPLCASVVLLLGGCDQMARSWYLSGCDRDIKNFTQAIESARDDAQRAAAYAQRGRAYSEKARYSRAFKLIHADEYGRLFSLVAYRAQIGRASVRKGVTSLWHSCCASIVISR
jgi:hypothetical protein